MPESKNFFEGYSRSKDMLTTMASKLTSATMAHPWTLKSSGRITSTTPNFNGKHHVCLKKDFGGNIINVLFVDTYNTETNNVYGAVSVYLFANDGCNVAEDVYIDGIYRSTSVNCPLNLSFHSNQVADTEATPQFAWFWIWADNEETVISLFGNQGAAGTASPLFRAIYLGRALPAREEFKSTFAAYELYDNKGYLFDSLLWDYKAPEEAPYDWRNQIQSAAHSCIDIISASGYSANSNPNVFTGKYIASRPQLSQGGEWESYSGKWYDKVITHTLGSNSLLFCMPGNTLYRGDIVVIDEEKCDYIFQSLRVNMTSEASEPWQSLLIKRMESVSDLAVTNNAGSVELGWMAPETCYGIKIVRKIDSEPQSHTDGVEVFNQTLDTGLLSGQAQVAVDSSAVAGNHYFYRAFAYSSNGVYSVPVASATADITM